MVGADPTIPSSFGAPPGEGPRERRKPVIPPARTSVELSSLTFQGRQAGKPDRREELSCRGHNAFRTHSTRQVAKERGSSGPGPRARRLIVLVTRCLAFAPVRAEIGSVGAPARR